MSHQLAESFMTLTATLSRVEAGLKAVTQYVRDNLDKGVSDLDMPVLDPIIAAADKRLSGNDPELTAALKSDIFAHPGKRNMWSAYGAVEKGNSATLLDIMGISSQLIFPSIMQDVLLARKISSMSYTVAVML